MLIAQRTVVGRNPVAIVWVFAGFHLVDEITHEQGVVLRGAENQGLFVLGDLLHEEFDPIRFTFPDFDKAVKVSFLVTPASFDFPFHNVIVRRVHID